MSEVRRREFIKIAGLGTAATMLPGIPGLLAQEGAKAAAKALPALVVIYQRGGMDAINAVVPYGDKRYRLLRSKIALPSADGAEGPGIIKLDDMFGLHPSLKALKSYWDAKQFAPIINVGSPHETRSHFDAQDFMEYAAPGNKTVRNGWLNRYLKSTKDKCGQEKGDTFQLRALAMQGLLPRALRGDVPVLAVPENQVLKNDQVLDTFGDVYGQEKGAMEGARQDDDPVVTSGKDTLDTLKKYKEAIDKHKKDRTVKYPSGQLGQKLADIASMIYADVGLEIAAVDVGGWDHHANEGGNSGVLATMLKNLADSLVAFTKDLGDRTSSTLVVCMTEFGRTCRENGNSGTDHGHGGAMFLLGGAVKGGKVYGDWRGLEDNALYQARDLPVTTDFRDVFADVLRNHLKYDVPKDFFPEYTPKTVEGLF